MSQLKAGAMLSYVVLGLNTLVGVLYTPYMLRMFGTSEYGLYSLVASVVSYLTILDLGFGNAIVRYTAKFRAEGKAKEQYTMFGMFIILYTIIGLVALVAGLILSVNVENLFSATMDVAELNRARIMLLLLSFNLAITFPFSLFGSIITAYENFVFQKVVQIVRIILNTVTMIVLLSMGYKAIALVVTTTIFNILSLLINFFYCKYRIKIKICFERLNLRFFKEVSLYSFYILLNVVMDRIYWSSGQFILGVVAGTTAVAIYSVAITLQQMYMSFSTAISGVFLPKVTAMVTKNQPDSKISDLFIRVGRIQFVAISFILTGFIIFGQQFIKLWAGEQYSQSYIIALLFFVPLTVPLIQNLGIIILQARNEMRFRSILYVIIAICSLVISIPLAKKYGVIGCAIGTSSALLAGQVIIMNVYYHRRQRINIIAFWKEILKMSVTPLFFGLLFYVVTQQIDINSVSRLLFAMTIFIMIAIPLYWFTIMNTYEKGLVFQALKPMKNKIKISCLMTFIR